MPTPRRRLLFGARPRYNALFRDRFLTVANPLVSGAADVGERTISGTRFFTLNGRLRGGSQLAGYAWGNSKHVGSAVDRTSPIALICQITPEDAAAFVALGFATAPNITDPRTDGHGFEIGPSFGLYAIAPGLEIALQNDSTARNLQAAQYLAVIVAQKIGSYILLSALAEDKGGKMSYIPGIPQYPQAALIWADTRTQAGTTNPLYPYISCERNGDGASGYPNGHAFEDLEVIPLTTPAWATQDGIADASDRFDRADSTTSLGPGWTAQNGVFGISGNQAYNVSGTGFQIAYKDAPSDGHFYWEWIPGVSNPGLGGIFRRVDNTNYLRIWTNNASQLQLQKWVNNGFGGGIYGTGVTITAGVKCRVDVYAKGNQYKILFNGASIHGDTWQTDSGNTHLTGRGVGLFSNAAQTSNRWGPLGCWPLSVTLPAEVLASPQKPAIWQGGAVLLSETFAGSSGLPAGWVAESGTWERSGDTLICSSRVAGENRITYDLGSYQDREIDYEMYVPASMISTSTILAGVYIAMTNTSNRVGNRPYKHLSQQNNDELENLEDLAGAGIISHKQNIGAFWAADTWYRLKLQIKGDLMHVFLWDSAASAWRPRTSYIHRQSGGSKIALFLDNATIAGLAFRNVVIRAL